MRSNHDTRAMENPLAVLSNLCELADLTIASGRSGRAAFDMMLASCVNVMAEEGTLDRLREVGARIGLFPYKKEQAPDVGASWGGVLDTSGA